MSPVEHVSSKCNILILFFLVLSLAVISPVSGDGGVGVEVGDWAEYDIRAGKLNRTVSEPWMKSFINRINGIAWINVTVEERTGPMEIRISETTHYQNGTSQTENYTGSVRTGGDLRYWVVPGGLKTGDRISVQKETGNFTVRNVRTKEYSNATRSLIHGAMQKRPEKYSLQIFEGYWDQQTGILCESLLTYQGSTREHVVVVKIEMVHTNIWPPDSNQPDSHSMGGWWLPVVITVVLAIILFSLVRRGKQKSTR